MNRTIVQARTGKQNHSTLNYSIVQHARSVHTVGGVTPSRGSKLISEPDSVLPGHDLT